MRSPRARAGRPDGTCGSWVLLVPAETGMHSTRRRRSREGRHRDLPRGGRTGCAAEPREGFRPGGARPGGAVSAGARLRYAALFAALRSRSPTPAKPGARPNQQFKNAVSRGGMKAFVTGGTGFVGTPFVRRLVADGWD